VAAAADPHATDATAFGQSLIINRTSSGGGGAAAVNKSRLNTSSVSATTPTGTERLSLTQAANRWFDLIRNGGSSGPATALREIRSYSEREPAVVIECCDATGRNLLHEAAWSGSIELFQELLALAIRASHAKPTATSLAIWASEQHNVAAWAQGPSRYVTPNGGNTVLHTAVAAGRADLCDWMLRQGAVFVAMAQARNKRGSLPLDVAMERGFGDVAQILARSTVAQ
jgi:hypothetical protein